MNKEKKSLSSRDLIFAFIAFLGIIGITIYNLITNLNNNEPYHINIIIFALAILLLIRVLYIYKKTKQ